MEVLRVKPFALYISKLGILSASRHGLSEASDSEWMWNILGAKVLLTACGNVNFITRGKFWGQRSP